MPAMANLTVKKADEVTNITYDALTGAAGDGSKAVWRQDTGAVAGMPVGHRATFEMATRENGSRSARHASTVFKRPYSTQNTVTSKYETSDSVVISSTAVLPKAIPASEIAEAVHQACNLLAATLIKDALKAGYSPQ
jgi:hypothetical protein